MAVRPEDFDFISNFDTVWAVALGAILATLGGFAATQMERVMGRRYLRCHPGARLGAAGDGVF